MYFITININIHNWVNLNWFYSVLLFCFGLFWGFFFCFLQRLRTMAFLYPGSSGKLEPLHRLDSEKIFKPFWTVHIWSKK